MPKYPSLIIAGAAVAAVGIFLTLGKASARQLDLKCYFQDARGLHAGARARVAGVEVGSVTSVRVRPELHDHPAEVAMTLNTPYELKIPNDSIVILETAGLLGEVFPEISLHGATGPPLQSGGVLKSAPNETVTPQQWAECLSNLADHKPCDLRGKSAPATQRPAGSPERR